MTGSEQLGKGLAFSRNIEVLQRRLDYLQEQVMEAAADDKRTSYNTEEIRALGWALMVLRGKLDDEVTREDMRNFWLLMKRQQSELDEDLKLFISFLDWQEDT